MVDLPGITEISRTRIRQAGKTGLATGLAKGTLLVGVLATVPLVERQLGPQQLGVWLTMVTLTSLLGFSDLGLGNGVMTEVARASGHGDARAARATIANGLALLAAAGAATSVLVLLGLRLIDVTEILGVRSASDRSEVAAGLTLFGLLFAIAIPFTIAEKLQWGLERGYIASTWSLVSATISIISIVLVLRSNGGLPELAIAYMGVPLLISIANTAWSFLVRFKELRPRWADLRKRDGLRLLRVGFLYLVLQTAAAVAFASDNLIMATRLGSEHVPDLAVPARLFGLISVGLSLFLAPLWPAYANALASGEYHWVRRTLQRSLVVAGFLALLSGAVLAITGGDLIVRFIGYSNRPSPGLLVALALWTTILALGTAIAMFYNAAGEIGFQVLVACAMAVVVVVLKVSAVAQHGAPGVVWGGVIGYLTITGISLIWYTPRLLRRIAPTSVP